MESDRTGKPFTQADVEDMLNNKDIVIPLNRKERRAKAKNKNYEVGHYQRIRNNDTHYHK